MADLWHALVLRSSLVKSFNVDEALINPKDQHVCRIYLNWNMISHIYGFFSFELTSRVEVLHIDDLQDLAFEQNEVVLLKAHEF